MSEVEHALAHLSDANASLNFLVGEVVRTDHLDGPRPGPFFGRPILVKDLKDVRGAPTRSGSRSRPGTIAEADDPYVERLRRAGFVILGKSATSELGYLPTCEPLASGPTRNPWDVRLSTGGSSGGAAAAVAAGVLDIAHASDGGGSIRIPAACCGVFGFKPSRGRITAKLAEPRPIEIAVQHAVTRTVRDSALLLSVTEDQGPDAAFAPAGFVQGPPPRPLKIAVATAIPEAVPEIAAAVAATAETLRRMGHAVVEATWPFGESFMDEFIDYWSLGAAAEIAAAHSRLGRRPDEREFEPFTLDLAERGLRLDAAAKVAAVERLKAAAALYDAQFEFCDVVMGPTVRTPPPPLGWLRGDRPVEEMMDRFNAFTPYTPIHNVAGAPAMSAPLGRFSSGLPIGVHFAGRRGDDALLLQLAYALETSGIWDARVAPERLWFGDGRR